MQYTEVDILVGKVLKHCDNETFDIKINYGTRYNRASYKGKFTFKASEIVVNNVNYSAFELEQSFVAKNLLNKQVMCVVRSSKKDLLFGEIIKMPNSEHAAIAIDNNMVPKSPEMQVA